MPTHQDELVARAHCGRRRQLVPQPPHAPLYGVSCACTQVAAPARRTARRSCADTTAAAAARRNSACAMLYSRGTVYSHLVSQFLQR
jgi:hypothetical protein